MVTSRKEAQYFVKGEVRVNQPVQGESEVAITWRVTSGGGRELGKVNQFNRVPSGALSNRWGRLAYAVAKAASAGIEGVVRRARYHKESHPSLKIPIRERTLGDSES